MWMFIQIVMFYFLPSNLYSSFLFFFSLNNHGQELQFKRSKASGHSCLPELSGSVACPPSAFISLKGCVSCFVDSQCLSWLMPQQYLTLSTSASSTSWDCVLLALLSLLLLRQSRCWAKLPCPCPECFSDLHARSPTLFLLSSLPEGLPPTLASVQCDYVLTPAGSLDGPHIPLIQIPETRCSYLQWPTTTIPPGAWCQKPGCCPLFSPVSTQSHCVDSSPWLNHTCFCHSTPLCPGPGPDPGLGAVPLTQATPVGCSLQQPPEAGYCGIAFWSS